MLCFLLFVATATLLTATQAIGTKGNVFLITVLYASNRRLENLRNLKKIFITAGRQSYLRLT